jgi:hypothetical protein
MCKQLITHSVCLQCLFDMQRSRILQDIVLYAEAHVYRLNSTAITN